RLADPGRGAEEDGELPPPGASFLLRDAPEELVRVRALVHARILARGANDECRARSVARARGMLPSIAWHPERRRWSASCSRSPRCLSCSEPKPAAVPTRPPRRSTCARKTPRGLTVHATSPR